jgi:hypothetical protein
METTTLTEKVETKPSAEDLAQQRSQQFTRSLIGTCVDIFILACLHRLMRRRLFSLAELYQLSFYYTAASAVMSCYLIIYAFRGREMVEVAFRERGQPLQYLKSTIVLYANAHNNADFISLIPFFEASSLPSYCVQFILAIFLADAVSWLVHFTGDTLGPKEFFEAHHYDPMDMTRRSYSGRTYDSAVSALLVRAMFGFVRSLSFFLFS